MISPLKILLIEDDEDTRGNLRDILELDDHEVVVAANAQEARERSTVDDVDLVILDHKLPDSSADELLPELRERLPHAAVIIVTGFGDMNSIISALREGAVDYILKPINSELIRNRINVLVGHRRVEHQLRKEHEFAEKIVNTAEAIVLVLDLSGKIIRFNPHFEQMCGWELEEVVGKDWFDYFISEADRVRLKTVFMNTAWVNDTHGIINAVLDRKGFEHQIRWSNTALTNDLGQVSAVLAVGTEITDLIEAQTQMLHDKRLAAIGQTMAALAHESRNSLQRIQASTDLLSLELSDNSDAQNDLNVIRRASKDLNDMLEEIRSYAAPIHLHREPVRIAEIWRRVWNELDSLQRGRACQIIESIEEVDDLFEVDVFRCGQIFRNLFENTLSAISGPVVVRVSCRRDENGALVITVGDNGPGLDIQQREKIFDPFFTTKSTGTGLGMSIVQRIVHAHGGSIKVLSQEDRFSTGACFEIQLPRNILTENFLPECNAGV